MNYKFEISLPEYSGFRAELAIKGEQTFQQLHEKILEIIEFGDSQITSFYTMNRSGERVKEITLMDMSMEEENSDILVMDATKIEEVINYTCIELEYVYDFLNEKYLKVEYSGEYVADSADILPLCLSQSGIFPASEENLWDGNRGDNADDEYDDSFMEEFSDYSGGEDKYEEEDDYRYGDDDEGFSGSGEEYGEDGYSDGCENIDDYIDRL